MTLLDSDMTSQRAGTHLSLLGALGLAAGAAAAAALGPDDAAADADNAPDPRARRTGPPKGQGDGD